MMPSENDDQKTNHNKSTSLLETEQLDTSTFVVLSRIGQLSVAATFLTFGIIDILLAIFLIACCGCRLTSTEIHLINAMDRLPNFLIISGVTDILMSLVIGHPKFKSVIAQSLQTHSTLRKSTETKQEFIDVISSSRLHIAANLYDTGYNFRVIMISFLECFITVTWIVTVTAKILYQPTLNAFLDMSEWSQLNRAMKDNINDWDVLKTQIVVSSTNERPGDTSKLLIEVLKEESAAQAYALFQCKMVARQFSDLSCLKEGMLLIVLVTGFCIYSGLRLVGTKQYGRFSSNTESQSSENNNGRKIYEYILMWKGRRY